MKLRLKEEPTEWRNFTLICCVVLLVLCALAARAGVNRTAVMAGCALWAVVGLVAIWYPPAFRGFYRAAMTMSFRIGQVLGRVTLGLVYLLVVTPLGLAMRLARKDPLDVKRKSNENPYWKKPRRVGTLEKLF